MMKGCGMTDMTHMQDTGPISHWSLVRNREGVIHSILLDNAVPWSRLRRFIGFHMMLDHVKTQTPP